VKNVSEALHFQISVLRQAKDREVEPILREALTQALGMAPSPRWTVERPDPDRHGSLRRRGRSWATARR
jgi:hypothetical protein